MASIQNFEELKSWQKARTLCQLMYQLTNNKDFAKDFSLRDQIKRSSGSAMDNIAEGFDRNSSNEFRQYLFIAKASTSEVKSQLYRALDQKYISKKEFNQTYELASDVSNLIGGLLNYLRNNNWRKIQEPTVEYGKETHQKPQIANNQSTDELQN